MQAVSGSSARIRAGGKSGTLRASVFGVSDGLVSNLALILGVAGSGVDAPVVVLAGVAGLLAGAFSMGAGEYISMKVQREVWADQLGRDSDERGVPVGAALSSFVTFCVGAFIPLAPFLIAEGTGAVIAAFAAGAVALASVGGSMAWMSHRPVWLGSTRMLVLGLGTAVITFGIGTLFGVVVV